MHGEDEMPEEELDHLEGYRGSAPVRIGNEAAEQFQLEVFGELVVSRKYRTDRGRERLSRPSAVRRPLAVD